MRHSMLMGFVAVALMSGCAATAPRTTTVPPPFECTSIHPEVCALEEQFHVLRFEQAAQNAAIDEAERKRKAAHGETSKNSG